MPESDFDVVIVGASFAGRNPQDLLPNIPDDCSAVLLILISILPIKSRISRS